MNSACHTYEVTYVPISHMPHVSRVWETCLMSLCETWYSCVIWRHVWMRHVSHTHMKSHTYESHTCLMSHACVRHDSCVQHAGIRHMPYTRRPYHTRLKHKWYIYYICHIYIHIYVTYIYIYIWVMSHIYAYMSQSVNSVCVTHHSWCASHMTKTYMVYILYMSHTYTNIYIYIHMSHVTYICIHVAVCAQCVCHKSFMMRFTDD